MRRNNGFTLIEIIITIALIGLITGAAFRLFMLGNKVQEMGLSEYETQAATRLVSENINRISRYSTAVFTIPETSFKETNLTDGWDYIGVLNDEVVIYTYSEVNGTPTHSKKIVVPSNPEIEFKIEFNESDADHDYKILKFSIHGFIKGQAIQLDGDGNAIPYIEINSQVESLNSMQIIHKGTEINPAVAVAFRSEDRSEPEIQKTLPVAQIAMVLDTSGSMNWKMNGYSTNTESLRRIKFLRDAATELITNFESSDNPVSISLVPFSTNANNPKSFRSAQTEGDILKSNIASLVADGGTNTGDGIRRAYHKIINGRLNADYIDKKVSDYIIILVDGVTTFGTRTIKYNDSSPFMTLDGNVTSRRYVYGNGRNLDTVHGTPYVNLIGNMIQDDGNIKVFVIGFSSRASDLGSVDDIVTATGAQPKLLAGDVDELKLAFGEIEQQILSELWYISGPDL